MYKIHRFRNCWAQFASITATSCRCCSAICCSACICCCPNGVWRCTIRSVSTLFKQTIWPLSSFWPIASVPLQCRWAMKRLKIFNRFLNFRIIFQLWRKLFPICLIAIYGLPILTSYQIVLSMDAILQLQSSNANVFYIFESAGVCVCFSF